MIRVTRCIIPFCLGVLVSSMEKTQMYMKRSQASDQSMSASGYSFNDHDDFPKDFSFEIEDEDKALKILKDLGFEPNVRVGRYATEPVSLPYEQYYQEYLKGLEKTPFGFGVNQEKYHVPHFKFYGSYSPLDQYEKITYPPLYPYAHGFGHDSHDIGKFLKEGGKYYGNSDFAKHGEKTDTGYNTVDAFDKALKGSYNKDDSKSYYNQNGGNKLAAFDNGGNYASKNSAGHVTFGESFGQNKGHNKGSKTTGYHKVYNKNDFNKQHKFYDKADKRGHFSKYGNYDAKNGNEQGQYVKGGNANQGYANNEYGIKDASDQGKFEDVDKGFKGAAGNEGFYNNYAGFSKNGGQESGNEHGYSVQ